MFPLSAGPPPHFSSKKWSLQSHVYIIITRIYVYRMTTAKVALQVPYVTPAGGVCTSFMCLDHVLTQVNVSYAGLDQIVG